MVTGFVDKLNEAFRRNEQWIRGLNRAISLEQLKQKMIAKVEKNLKISEAKRRQIINNITGYKLHEAAWEDSPFMLPGRVAEHSGEHMPVWEGKEREMKRVRTIVAKERIEDILTSFREPGHRRTISTSLAEKFGLSYHTLYRDVYPLLKAGYLELIERGTYRITSLGEDILDMVEEMRAGGA